MAGLGTAIRSGLALVALAGAFGLVATASAQTGAKGVAPTDKVFRGETGDGVKVKLTVGEFGNPTSFKVSGSEIECEEGTLSTKKITFLRFDVSDPGEFHDNSRDTSKSGAFKFKSKTKLTGAEKNGTWTGTYNRTTTVIKDGSQVDLCRVDTTWSAS